MYISDFLGGKQLSVSFEFFPPKTDTGRPALMRAVDRLANIAPNFVSLTYGAGGTTRSQTFDLVQEIQTHTSALVMAHLTGLCHSEAEIAEIADRLWNIGVTNIMALRGDRPRDMADDTPLPGVFPYGRDLIKFLKGRHPFCLGGGCYPDGHAETTDIELGIEHLREKIDAGCDFLVTDMFFDNDCFFRFQDRLDAKGIRVPMLPGIMPITSFAQLDKFQNQFGVKIPKRLAEQVAASEADPAAVKEVGIRWAAEQCQALIDQGVTGLHFYTLNLSNATVQVCESLNLHERQRSIKT